MTMLSMLLEDWDFLRWWVAAVVVFVTVCGVAHILYVPRKPREPLRDPYGDAFLAAGLKGFPECEECQCYPEGRVDCPDHVECNKRLRA